MKWLAGVGGALVSALVYLSAEYVSSFYSPPITDPVPRTLVTLSLFFLAILEIPFMTFGLCQIARTPNPRLLGSLIVGYTAFGGIYAALLVLATREGEWGRALVAAGWLRVLSLLWVR